MADNGDNFGGTTLTGENGEHMDPAIAGISPPSIPTMEGDAAGAAIGADLDDDDAGDAEMTALGEEDGESMADKADLVDADSVLDPEPGERNSDEADVTASGAE